MTDIDLSKVAQKTRLAVEREIARLRQNEEYWRTKYDVAAGQAEPTRVTVDELDHPVYLEENVRVKFQTGGEYDYVEVHLIKESNGYSVSVRSGSSSLVVHPQSGNSIRVRPESR
jgi:hypothetical protein